MVLRNLNARLKSEWGLNPSIRGISTTQGKTVKLEYKDKLSLLD